VLKEKEVFFRYGKTPLSHFIEPPSLSVSLEETGRIAGG
jgi:hypothetical protein